MTAVEPINFKRASRHERTFKQKESNAFACNKEADNCRGTSLIINARIYFLVILKLPEKETLRMCDFWKNFFPSVLKSCLSTQYNEKNLVLEMRKKLYVTRVA